MASEKRCHYEVLGLSLECTADEIRTAYRKLALQRHPDKLVQSGLAQSDATAQFQELQQAYEVLSDPKERAWYDSHRSQILFSDPSSADSVPNSVIPNLFSFFSKTVFSGYSDTGKGFYKVFSDVFNKIYANEIDFARKLGLRLDLIREAPVMGNLDSPYTQVTAFYSYWLGFATIMDFCWVDMYDSMAGPNRKSRRVMEEENKKLRKKAKKDYNETVRGLAEFVKKRDKRVIDMAMKRNLEMEKKREEERERKKRMERERLERLERAMAYEEPDWVKVGEADGVDYNSLYKEEEEEKRKKSEEKELYCVVCGKKFKSEKQWKNHEQSKKHKEKVAEFRDSIADEEDEYEEGEGTAMEEDKQEEKEEERVDVSIDELSKSFQEGNIGIEIAPEVGDESGPNDVSDINRVEKGVNEVIGLDHEDEEIGFLEAMLSGRKNRRKAEFRANQLHVHNNSEDTTSFMEYDNRKSTIRNRESKKGMAKRNGEENSKVDTNRSNAQTEEPNGDVENSRKLEESSCSLADKENVDEGGDGELVMNKKKTSSKMSDRKEELAMKNEAKMKTKASSRGKKSKATSKNAGNLCNTCGKEFESRNKLHGHLEETGHASVKYR